MYIREIELRNVRGFFGARDVTLDLTRPDGALAGWTVLAGRNGSGKTSLLRAVALAVGGPGVARNLVSDFSGWVSVGEAVGVCLRAADLRRERRSFPREWAAVGGSVLGQPGLAS
ncbi:hypothetical protein Ate02nite_94250 [Paractinoplanes tereljensis]|uniref:Rad50/SbcC-type AAA domain-containing protein n=1 Tax=Paractinoplanes tereljensis TaxID=571912 RepID=A0A919NWU6_9ACTN|nr:hypothetical protein Ate02nite_94250 [Actinoplanes tereljensis]